MFGPSQNVVFCSPPGVLSYGGSGPGVCMVRESLFPQCQLNVFVLALGTHPWVASMYKQQLLWCPTNSWFRPWAALLACAMLWHTCDITLRVNAAGAVDAQGFALTHACWCTHDCWTGCPSRISRSAFGAALVVLLDLWGFIHLLYVCLSCWLAICHIEQCYFGRGLCCNSAGSGCHLICLHALEHVK